MIQIVMDSIVIVDDFSLMSTIEFGVKCNSTRNAIFLMDVFLHHSVFNTRNLFRKPGQLLIWQKTILQSEFSFISRINLWHMEITDQSFNIVDIKPANMEELTEVITASEFHPKECNHFVYSSSKGTIRLCDMRSAALCDNHAKRKGFIFMIIDGAVVAFWYF